jgi:hypothetical protein
MLDSCKYTLAPVPVMPDGEVECLRNITCTADDELVRKERGVHIQITTCDGPVPVLDDNAHDMCKMSYHCSCFTIVSSGKRSFSTKAGSVA